MVVQAGRQRPCPFLNPWTLGLFLELVLVVVNHTDQFRRGQIGKRLALGNIEAVLVEVEGRTEASFALLSRFCAFGRGFCLSVTLKNPIHLLRWGGLIARQYDDPR